RDVDDAHARDHGVRDDPARGHQSPGGRASCVDPDGGRRDRSAVRRSRRPENQRRAVAAPARTSGARGGASICLRPRADARRHLFAPAGGARRMTRNFAAIALIAALATARTPASAERLIASLSNHRVGVTSSFTGDQLALFGVIEREADNPVRRGGYDIVVTVPGPHQALVTFRKSRILGIWVNADSRVFENAPAYLAVVSNRRLDAIANAETLRRLQVGLANVTLNQRAAA